MTWAILVEGLHSATGATRREIHELITKFESAIAGLEENIARKLGRALNDAGTPEEGADAVMQIASDRRLTGDAFRVVAGFAGAAWGAGIASAGLNATGAVVAVGLGIELAPVIAIILGLLLMFYCGRYTFRVVSTLISRLSDAAPAN